MSVSNIIEMPSNVSTFVATLKAVIKKSRDILRLEGITGMDSMKHLTLYTLLRRLDTNECKKLKIPVKFSWEKFMDLKDDHQRCFNLLYCKNGATDDLISCLDTLFGTKNFNFKLSNPTYHVEILNEFKKLDFSNLDGKIDILGTIYEIHLSSGSNKSAMRDLGQFFTERDVCKYMTALCNPKMLSDGRAESVLDPTMGTGGFLSSYIQHLGNSVDWSKMHNDIAGYDIDEFVMSIGRINLYLQTGQLFERIEHRDTLSNDIGTETQRLKFKNILANMPFGVSGLTHAGCCKRVRNLKIQSTKSEPLFLQLMMASLDDGGRCAVVVPDGVLTNITKGKDSSKRGYNGTRKYLLDNFELKRVIKMKGQFFSNTGIQPSILFFENTGKPTSATEFWEVEKNSVGVITEKLIVCVPREKIDTDSYSLDMRCYVEVTVSEKASEFPMVKLGDIMKSVKGTRYNVGDGTDTGKYPLIRSSKDGSVKWMDTYTHEGPLIAVGNGGIANFHYAEKFNASTHTLVYDCNETANKKYVYYMLKYNSDHINESCFKGTGLKNLKLDDFNEFAFPLPPLEIQEQIVAELDRIYENAHKATQMATSIKTQMVSVMKSVGMRGYERKKLGELYNNITYKKKIYKSEIDNIGSIPFYNGSWNSPIGTHSIESFTSDKNYFIVIKDGGGDHDSDKVGLGMFFNIKGPCAVSGHLILLPKKEYESYHTYVHHYVNINIKHIRDLATRSVNLEHISKDSILNYEIPLPPLETQQQILTILNEMEGERKSLEQMASKAEERAKFILDGYLNSA